MANLQPRLPSPADEFGARAPIELGIYQTAIIGADWLVAATLLSLLPANSYSTAKQREQGF
jgi:hypothetical protein